MKKSSIERQIIDIKLIPRASKPGLFYSGGILRAKVSPPPVENKANKALIELLARQMNIAKSRIRVLTGFRSSRKRVEINGTTREAICQFLSNIRKRGTAGKTLKPGCPQESIQSQGNISVKGIVKEQ